jgi:hypothetical protein
MCGKIKTKSMINYAEELDEEYFHLLPLQTNDTKTLTIPSELRVSSHSAILFNHLGISFISFFII